MPKNKDVDGMIDAESEAWNVAKGFTMLKVLKPMVDLDKYENIAQFGTVEMDEQIPIANPDIAQRRVQGLKRLLTTLRQLIGNVQFAFKKGDREKIATHLNTIDTVDNVFEGVFEIKENMVTHEKEFIVNEAHFTLCFKTLQKIKDEVNKQLNSAGLIFRESDEVDLDKIMNQIIEGG